MANPNTATIAATRSGLTKVTFLWTSSSGGSVTITSAEQFTGYVVGIETIPDGTDVPTDLYDITLTDDDGMDIMGGQAADRSSTTKQFAQPIWQSFTVAVPIVLSKMALNVTNAGNAKSGKAIVYIHHTK